MNRPESSEYADYYANYISKVPGSDVLGVLESQRLQMLQLFTGAKRAGRKLPVCARKMDGKGSSRAHHGYRTHFYLPGIAVRAR